jgi:hypothetical protein
MVRASSSGENERALTKSPQGGECHTKTAPKT